MWETINLPFVEVCRMFKKTADIEGSFIFSFIVHFIYLGVFVMGEQ